MSEVEETEPLLASTLHQRESSEEGNKATFESSPKRWFMVAVLALLNFSNGMIWITFGSIADVTAEFYGIGANAVNWLSLVFIVISVPLGIFAIWTLERSGLRKVIFAASWLNLIGALLRIVSIFESIDTNFQYPILISGQCIAAYAQPFLVFSTTKLAAVWFSDEQRAIANAITSMANPLGILTANVIAPLIVQNKDQLFWMLELTAVPAGLGTFFTYMIVTSERPLTPPSASAYHQPESFIQGFKSISKNSNYWILCYAFSSGLALFTTLFTLLEQILCSRGYHDEYSGICVALQIGFGLVGAACLSAYVDRSKKFEQVTKIGICLCALSLIAFSLISLRPHLEALVAILISCVGLFGFGIYPVMLELAVECTYPVAEATSTGVLILVGQLQSVVYILLSQVLGTTYKGTNSVCNTEGPTGIQPLNYTVSNLVVCGMLVLATVAFVIFFKCDYKRLNAEKVLISERLVSGRMSPSRPMLRYT